MGKLRKTQENVIRRGKGVEKNMRSIARRRGGGEEKEIKREEKGRKERRKEEGRGEEEEKRREIHEQKYTNPK